MSEPMSEPAAPPSPPTAPPPAPAPPDDPPGRFPVRLRRVLQMSEPMSEPAAHSSPATVPRHVLARGVILVLLVVVGFALLRWSPLAEYVTREEVLSPPARLRGGWGRRGALGSPPRRWAPRAEYVTREAVLSTLDRLRDAWWAPGALIAGYALLCPVGFPPAPARGPGRA